MRSHRGFGFFMRFSLVTFALLPPGAPAVGGAALSFEQRVAAQRTIEEVYWRHRSWPKENPGSKPPLSAVLPEAAIRDKVVDYMKKSTALEHFWRRPITAAQLQAEMDRMSHGTLDPRMLGELYAALGNDPRLIAETLARRTLTERLVRSWYARDERFHGDLERQAENALARTSSIAAMARMGGKYAEVTYRLRPEDTAAASGNLDPQVVLLTTGKWASRRREVAARFGNPAGEIPVLRLSDLHEDDERFFVMAVLSNTDEAMTVATVTWEKPSFSAWWAAVRTGLTADVEAEPGSFTLSAPSGTPCPDDTWQALWTLPDPRTDYTAVWTGSEMIVWGGLAGGAGATALATGGRYDPSTDTWLPTSMGTDVPSKRAFHTAVWTGTEMIVWGASQSASPDTGARYNPVTDTWMPTSTTGAPSKRYLHTAVWTGTEMIVWGGFGGAALNTGGRYDPSADSWVATSTGANLPSARYGHTAVWTGTKMIVWGGRVSSSTNTNTGGRYDPSANSWLATSTGANLPSARYSHTAVWTGAEMIVWGGRVSSSTNTNTGARYDPSADSWLVTSTGANVPLARYIHTAVWTGAEMIVWGGSSGPGVLNTGARYDPSADSWLPTSTGANVPSKRTGHTAVWTGTEMIVWGGDFNTGGRYDPVADSWLPTSTGLDVPSAREGHTAVWTGTEMIVWGGRVSSSTATNTGGRYDPSTDTWLPTSTGADVPEGREDHTAVWTGTEMIVWGGGEGSDPDTGGRYDPSTDGWAATSTGANHPSGRHGHTAVWTGTEMIVWGGQDTGFPATNLPTGGRYDPPTDTWLATSTGANAPSARYGHTAAWTGSEMIVWGGSNSDHITGGALSTGSRYNPVSDGWVATSTGANTPSARLGHTVVWTGTEMIVWGGGKVQGGRYDPVTDGWLATPTGESSPWGQRTETTAVWTGTEMIVWGGLVYVSNPPTPFPTDTGGRYDPSANGWLATSTEALLSPGRADHTAVWTGSEMIVWGGFPRTSNGGRYCACPTLTTSYADADGDGFGNPAQSLTTCGGSIPSGRVTNGSDCDDANADSWTVPGEVLDFTWSSKAQFGWSAPADPGAALGSLVYDTLRSLLSSDFGSTVCVETNDGSDTTAMDNTVPAVGEIFFYLPRAENPCGIGSLGHGTAGPRPPAIDCVE